MASASVAKVEVKKGIGVAPIGSIPVQKKQDSLVLALKVKIPLPKRRPMPHGCIYTKSALTRY